MDLARQMFGERVDLQDVADHQSLFQWVSIKVIPSISASPAAQFTSLTFCNMHSMSSETSPLPHQTSLLW